MTNQPKRIPLNEMSIRKLAHEIWEAEGRPDDRQLRHWLRAEEMLREPIINLPKVQEGEAG